MAKRFVEHAGKQYLPRHVVCVTVIPAYNQALHSIDKGIEAKISGLLEGLGPYCRVGKHQWLVATDESCGGIAQELEHAGADNLLVFGMLVDNDWKFSCKPKCEIDEWEFDGVGVFFQQKIRE